MTTRLGADSLAHRGQAVDMEIVDKNFEIIREYMMDMHPSIVANSEALSRNVKYFPSAPLAIARRESKSTAKSSLPRSGQNRSRHGRSPYALDLVVRRTDLFPVVNKV